MDNSVILGLDGTKYSATTNNKYKLSLKCDKSIQDFDLSLFALKSDIPTMPDVSNFALKSDIPTDYVKSSSLVNVALLSHLKPFVKSSDLPDFTSFITSEELISGVGEFLDEYSKIEHTHEDKADKTLVDSLINQLMELKLAMVEFDDSINEWIDIIVSSENMFNTWNRFSHSGSAQPANTSEMQDWAYDTVNDVISCTINSSTYIGFYSPESFENYAISAKLTSASADNDRMGIVIAVAIVDGKEYTLSAIRNNESSDTWGIWYNYLQDDAWQVVNGNSLIAQGSNWSNYLDGTKIKVKKIDGKVEAYSTVNNGSEYIAKLEVDLNSDDRLVKFIGNGYFGFACQSQDNTTFNEIKFLKF